MNIKKNIKKQKKSEEKEGDKMDLTDSFLNIENNDLKRKDNAYIYLNEKGGNITLNNMNKSGQELTEKKKKTILWG